MSALLPSVATSSVTQSSRYIVTKVSSVVSAQQCSFNQPRYFSTTRPSSQASVWQRTSSILRPGVRPNFTSTVQCWDIVLSQSKRSFHASTTFSAIQDPYKVLGVSTTAAQSEIKRAYYGLAKKYHPDTSKEANAKDKFNEAQTAYELLSDEKKREAFDKYGTGAFDENGGFNPGASGAGYGHGSAPGNPFSGFPGFSGGRGSAADFNLGDIFGFGQSAGRSDPFSQQILVGEDIQVNFTISFLEAAKGVPKEITINPLQTCGTCSGSGLRPGSKTPSCTRCGGSGQESITIGGQFTVNSTCQSCRGTGKSVPRGSGCGTCHGAGALPQKRTIKIDIPAGVEDGMRLSVSQKGHAPQSGGMGNNPSTRQGDLVVNIRVKPDPNFTRSGSNVHYTASIPITTAALGGEIEVPTLDGTVRLRVSTGTTTGDVITLPGRGIPKLSNNPLVSAFQGKGDMHVEFKVGTPKHLTSRQRTLLEMLADELNDPAAKRIMGVGRSSVDPNSTESHQNESFLKSAWHTITGKHSNLESELSEKKNNKGQGDDETKSQDK